MDWEYSTLRRGQKSESIKERNHLRDTGVDGKIMIPYLSEAGHGGCGLDSCGSGYVATAGSYTGTSGSINCNEFLGFLLKMDSSPLHC
jgi:hypothetical protein